jgi:D-serine deaminase-like pyridoxal phosphate-dependent protein
MRRVDGSRFEGVDAEELDAAEVAAEVFGVGPTPNAMAVAARHASATTVRRLGAKFMNIVWMRSNTFPST